jgi:hypothetical protein
VKALLIALAVAAGTSSGSVSVGYSNMSGTASAHSWSHADGLPPGSGTVPEVGDRVKLAGTDRTLKSVTVMLACGARNPSGTVDVTVRVRAIDTTWGFPGAVLSTATQTGVTYSSRHWQLTFAMPAATLPDEVFVTIEVKNGSQNAYGVYAKNGATVGSSDPDKWYLRGSDGLWGTASANGTGFGNLALLVQVEP